MNMCEAALNRVREIAIYETARSIANDDCERGIDNCIIEDYINNAKEELINIYPDVNWSTIKYGLDIR